MTKDVHGRDHRGLGSKGGQYVGRSHQKPERGLQADDWPAITYESRPWTVRAGYVSRSAARQHAGPYLAAVTPEIQHLDPELPLSLIAECEEAARAVVRFDAEVTARFGHPEGAREIAPMSAILLRTESASSSQIENLTVGARQIALAELGEHTNVNAKIVAGNVRSMEAALALSERVDDATVLAMHEALLAQSQPAHAGHWRDQQVWVGGGDAGPHRADFVPPHHDRVEAAIADVLAFANRDDLPVVAQVAITHAQFETIHPFIDGNGRTGRALVHAMFANKGLSERVTVPVSAGLLVNTESYFDALTAYRRGDVAPIVERFNEATLFAVGNGRQLVTDLKSIRESFDGRIKARSGAAANKLADLLIAQPVINTAYVQERAGISGVAAQNAINHLVSVGVLVQPNSVKRGRVWQSPEILGALDEFAARIRRVRG